MENLREFLSTYHPECLILEPAYFDRAALQVITNSAGQAQVQYSMEKVLDVLCTEEEMSYEDALEWYSFNIECAYLGPNTPCYISEHPSDDDDEDEET